MSKRTTGSSRRLLAGFVAICAALTFAIPAGAESPFTKSDATWITISGEVRKVSPNAFTLDYGDEGVIIIEMDDGDRDADGYKLLPGDKVTVTGRIDTAFFETTTIEASSVFVEKLGTTFFASAADEEDFQLPVVAPVVVSAVEVKGLVTSTDDEEFTLGSDLRELTVAVEEMPYNPLDDEGYQKIEVGDFVRVTGRIDDDLFEGRKLVADSVIELVD